MTKSNIKLEAPALVADRVLGALSGRNTVNAAQEALVTIHGGPDVSAMSRSLLASYGIANWETWKHATARGVAVDRKAGIEVASIKQDRHALWGFMVFPMSPVSLVTVTPDSVQADKPKAKAEKPIARSAKPARAPITRGATCKPDATAFAYPAPLSRDHKPDTRDAKRPFMASPSKQKALTDFRGFVRFADGSIVGGEGRLIASYDKRKPDMRFAYAAAAGCQFKSHFTGDATPAIIEIVEVNEAGDVINRFEPCAAWQADAIKAQDVIGSRADLCASRFDLTYLLIDARKTGNSVEKRRAIRQLEKLGVAYELPKAGFPDMRPAFYQQRCDTYRMAQAA